MQGGIGIEEWYLRVAQSQYDTPHDVYVVICDEEDDWEETIEKAAVVVWKDPDTGVANIELCDSLDEAEEKARAYTRNKSRSAH